MQPYKSVINIIKATWTWENQNKIIQLYITQGKIGFSKFVPAFSFLKFWLFILLSDMHSQDQFTEHCVCTRGRAALNVMPPTVIMLPLMVRGRNW